MTAAGQAAAFLQELAAEGANQERTSTSTRQEGAAQREGQAAEAQSASAADTREHEGGASKEAPPMARGSPAGNQQKPESGKQSAKSRVRRKPTKRTAAEAAAHARTLQKLRDFVLKRIEAKKDSTLKRKQQEADLVLNFAISSSAPKNVGLAR